MELLEIVRRFFAIGDNCKSLRFSIQALFSLSSSLIQIGSDEFESSLFGSVMSRTSHIFSFIFSSSMTIVFVSFSHFCVDKISLFSYSEINIYKK